MTNQLINTAFNAALADKKLIFGVLKKLNITRQNPDFDDYFQECILAYVDAYCRYAENGASLDRHTYLYIKLRQRVIDLLRKHDCYQRYFGHTAPDDRSSDTEHSLYQALLLQQLLTELPLTENQLFRLLYLQDDSITEICQQLKISRHTVYRRRTKLLAKLQQLL